MQSLFQKTIAALLVTTQLCAFCASPAFAEKEDRNKHQQTLSEIQTLLNPDGIPYRQEANPQASEQFVAEISNALNIFYLKTGKVSEEELRTQILLNFNEQSNAYTQIEEQTKQGQALTPAFAAEIREKTINAIAASILVTDHGIQESDFSPLIGERLYPAKSLFGDWTTNLAKGSLCIGPTLLILFISKKLPGKDAGLSTLFSKKEAFATFIWFVSSIIGYHFYQGPYTSKQFWTAAVFAPLLYPTVKAALSNAKAKRRLKKEHPQKFAKDLEKSREYRGNIPAMLEKCKFVLSASEMPAASFGPADTEAAAQEEAISEEEAVVELGQKQNRNTQ